MRLQPTLLALAGVTAIAATPLSFAQETPATTSPAVTSAAPVESSSASSTPASTMTSSASIERPARGLTMEKVEAKFGAPTQKDESVGTPPITRWEYPNYVVYFEHQYVLHTVVMK